MDVFGEGLKMQIKWGLGEVKYIFLDYIYICCVVIKWVLKYSKEGSILCKSELFSNIPIENKYSTLKIHLYDLQTQPTLGLLA